MLKKSGISIFFILLLLSGSGSLADEPLILRPRIGLGLGFDTNKFNDLYSVRQFIKNRDGGLVGLYPNIDIDYLSNNGTNILFSAGAKGEFFAGSGESYFYTHHARLNISRYYKTWKVGTEGYFQQFRVPDNTPNHFDYYRVGVFMRRFFNYRAAFDLKSGYGKKRYYRRDLPDNKKQEDKQFDYEGGLLWNFYRQFDSRLFYGYMDDNSNADTEDYRENRVGFEVYWNRNKPTSAKLFFEYANLDFAASPIPVRFFTSAREDNRYRASVKFNHYVLPWMELDVRYNFIYNQSNDPDEEYTKHEGIVTLWMDGGAYWKKEQSPILPRPLQPPVPSKTEINEN